MKILNPRVHGYLDYIAVLFLLVAPSLFGFSGVPATILYVIAAAYLVMILLTNYPLGVVKVIPFPLHGGVELLAGILFIALPWLAGFADTETTARNVYVATGATLFAVWLVTDYRAAEATRHVAA